jgi:hypothetical protein
MLACLQNILFITLASVMRIKEWHRVHVKAACTLMKLGSRSGSRSSPSLLLPHPRDQHTTHKCLPFSPVSPPTFLTWLRHGIMGVSVLTVWAHYHYYTFQKHHLISSHFLSNNSADGSLLLYIPRTSIYFHCFSQK